MKEFTAMDVANAFCNAIANEITEIEEWEPRGQQFPPQRDRLPGLRRALAIANNLRGTIIRGY